MMKSVVVLVIALAFCGSAHAWFLDYMWDVGQNLEDMSPVLSDPETIFEGVIGETSFSVPGQFTDPWYETPGGSKGMDNLTLSPAVNSTSSTYPGGHGNIQSYSDVYSDPTGDTGETPEPVTLLLLGAGLLGGALVRRRFRR